MINKKRLQKNSGFTLIEVLISIFILITAVVVPLTIGSKAYAFSNFVRDQSIASYLAQEGLEYVRLQRDNQSLTSGLSGWTNFKNITSSCFLFDGCQFDVQNNGSFINCPFSGCPPLYQQASGYYTYVPVTNKYFTRTVKMSLVLPPGAHPLVERVKVESTVTWSTNGISSRSITLTDYLMPWQI